MQRWRKKEGDVFRDRKDGSQRGAVLVRSLVLGAWHAGFPQHVLLHMHQAFCLGDSEYTARSAPQHTSSAGNRPGNQFYDNTFSPVCVKAETETIKQGFRARPLFFKFGEVMIFKKAEKRWQLLASRNHFLIPISRALGVYSGLAFKRYNKTKHDFKGQYSL